MTTAAGIDVSVYNANVGSLNGLDFVICRASIGAAHDARYATHSAAVRAAGKVLGAYHFAVYGPGPTRQANTLLATAGNASFLVVDDEGVALTHPATVRGIIANLHKLDTQRRHVLLYSSEGTWPGDLGQDGNWVANWSHAPKLPYLFWQTHGGPIDRNVFHGTADQLRHWSHTRRPA